MIAPPEGKSMSVGASVLLKVVVQDGFGDNVLIIDQNLFVCSFNDYVTH